MKIRKAWLILFVFTFFMTGMAFAADPPPPSNVQATTYLPYRVEITWSSIGNYLFFIYRSTRIDSGYSLIGSTYDHFFQDFHACPTVKPPQNVSATDYYSDRIGITWSNPIFYTPNYFYKIKAQQTSYPFNTSKPSNPAAGHVLDWLDTNSAIIVVSDSALGPYTTLATGLPSPGTGETTFWHTGLPQGATKYYRIYVLALYTRCPSDPSHIITGKTTGTPPPPPLSVDISGPGGLDWLEYGTWTALPSGGTGVYSYEWRSRKPGGAWSGVISTSQSYSTTMQHEDFELEVKISDGNGTVSSAIYVEFIGTWPPLP